MTQVKHTPLPWVVEGQDVENGIPFIQIVRDVESGKQYKYIAKVDCDFTNDDEDRAYLGEEEHANAAFIVNACNSHYMLLAEVKKLADLLEQSGFMGATDMTIDLARLAIDKAEGK